MITPSPTVLLTSDLNTKVGIIDRFTSVHEVALLISRELL